MYTYNTLKNYLSVSVEINRFPFAKIFSDFKFWVENLFFDTEFCIVQEHRLVVHRLICSLVLCNTKASSE